MPKIHESAISTLRPNQLTVGMIEVLDKKAHLASLNSQDQQDFMQAHPMPAVIGPDGNLYITDHHHLGRAELEAGVSKGFFLVEADLSAYGLDEFWKEMDRNLWVHPLDENGGTTLLRCHSPASGKTGRRRLPLPGRVRPKRRRF
ncbi:MAG: ParB-like protein [Thiobacillaceae bacterium]